MNRKSFDLLDAKAILKDEKIVFKKKFPAKFRRFDSIDSTIPQAINFDIIHKVEIEDPLLKVQTLTIVYGENYRVLRLRFKKFVPFLSLGSKEEMRDLVKELENRCPNLEEKSRQAENQKSEQKNSSAFNTERKRTCKAFGNVWHVKKSELKELRRKKKQNKTAGALTALTGNLAASSMSNKNQEDAKQKLEKLNKCPECRSSNYEEEKVNYS